MRTNLCCLCLFAVGAYETAPARAAAEKVIHSFANFPQGANPFGPLARDSADNLYGTTNLGGANNMGAVFKLTAAGKYHVLHSFTGGSDGANPYAGVTLDSSGNLYGTTTYGGGTANAGVVYKLSPSGQETVLYSFTGAGDGANPYAGVILDSSGNLYGTTYAGGTANTGVVYKLSPSGQESVLYSFTGKTDGANPYAGVIFDSAGNLYGTTYTGGLTTCTVPASAGCGVIYKLTPSGQETVLYTFPGGANGANPYAGVIADVAGNLYGTTSSDTGSMSGVVYKLDTTGTYKVLYSFKTLSGPRKPQGGLVLDPAGDLYGTTQQGGAANVGVVFELTTTGSFKTLYAFPGGGLFQSNPGPNPGVIRDSAGNLYGVTSYAAVGGTVFKLGAAGKESTLYSFLGAAGGSGPGAVMIGPGGYLYGVTATGGAANVGVVYKIDAAGRETVLYTFTGGADGAVPGPGVVLDSAGNVYGTTAYGGIASGGAGFGVVYEVDTSRHQTVLYTFTGGADGGLPNGVTLDGAGNLYGTTFLGGTAGLGVVFRVDPSGHETVLHNFTGGADGASPGAGVILDPAGTLYGTTDYGGTGGLGVIYKLDAAGQETVLYSFPGGPNGALPYGGVIRDSAGNLYGTTAGGGAGIGEGGWGLVFALDAAGNYAVLYTFTDGADGGTPLVGVVRDPAGNLYGATSRSGTAGCGLSSGCGVIYRVDPSGQLTVLYTFPGGADGAASAAIMRDTAGNIYGPAGPGTTGGGLVYKLSFQ